MACLPAVLLWCSRLLFKLQTGHAAKDFCGIEKSDSARAECPSNGVQFVLFALYTVLTAHSNKINKVLVGQAGGFIVKFNKEGADAV